MPNRVVPMVGKVFNRLTVLRLHEGPLPKGDKHLQYVAACICGAVKVVSGQKLRNGAVQSCGCFERERSFTHGKSGAPEYKVWASMKDRCGNPKSRGFKNYGARGITVCPRWNSFENFYADMGARPSPKHTLERVDNEMGYSPDNCVWATHQEQARNKRPRQTSIGPNGVHFDKTHGKFKATINVEKRVRRHLGTFDNVFDAIAARRSAENRYWSDTSETAAGRLPVNQ